MIGREEGRAKETKEGETEQVSHEDVSGHHRLQRSKGGDMDSRKQAGRKKQKEKERRK